MENALNDENYDPFRVAHVAHIIKGLRLPSLWVS
jgi:hypothetical protein